MALRRVCLYEGKEIGIESIFTIVDGHQINIPDKVEWLRNKSKQNLLFCPCGCGANLILVAGDQNLREQHFRIKHNTGDKECNAATETDLSIISKTQLKYWLGEKLTDNQIETRVRIADIDDSSRKYEFTLLNRKNRIAVSYCHLRENLNDEKIRILEGNRKYVKLFYFTDGSNNVCNGQYPEWNMKIQKVQGFCLFLSVNESDYNKTGFTASFYKKNLDGLWEEAVMAKGLLKDLYIDSNKNVIYRKVRVKKTAYR